MKMTRAAWTAIVRQAAVLMKRHERVAAIRLLREKTGCGLKEAYDATKRLG